MAPKTPSISAAPTTPSQPARSFRPSTIAASAKQRRATARRLNFAKVSTKRKKRPAGIQNDPLPSEYEECSTSEEEVEEIIVSEGEFKLNGRIFRKAAEIASGRQRKKISHVWDKDKGYEIVEVKTGKRHYYCIQCCDNEKDESYVPFIIKGTSNITEHWKNKHGIDKTGKPVSKKKRSSTLGLVSIIDFNAWKLLFIQWIVYCHIAINQIESMYFRKLVKHLNEAVAALIPSRNTIRKRITEEFERRKKDLRHELRAARSNIHISFDMWTSPNCYAIMAVIAHYIDSNGKRQAKLIALRYLEGEHTGENMAALLLKVFREYKIGGRIGFFVLDNASSNDTCVDLVLRKLYPRMNEKQRRRRRLRCLGHVVNLAAQAFLLGSQSQETLDQLGLANGRRDFEAIAKLWRKQGVLGRLHNIVRYIRMTPQRRAEWRKITIGSGESSLFDRLEVS
jgi:hypothetical protein